MRDPSRIQRISSALITLWERYPDQRLGQLLSNAYGREAEQRLFFIEDDEWEKALERTLREGF